MTSTTAQLLRHTVALLDRCGIDHMIAGSFASTYYAEPRTTQDVDIVIDPDAASLERLLDGLDPERFYVDHDTARDALRRRSMFNVIDLETGWKIDMVVRKARPFSVEELSRRRRACLLGVDVFLASPEDVVISKLEWAKAGGGSQRQLRDVAGILAAQAGNLDLAYVERWIAALGLTDEWAQVAPG